MNTDDSTTGIGHNSDKPLSPDTSGVRQIPISDIIIWPPLQRQMDDITQVECDKEVEAFVEVGQRAIATGRFIGDGLVEVVTKPLIVRAMNSLVDPQPTGPVTVEVRLVPYLSDDYAFRLNAQDLDAGYAASSLAQGRFFAEAIVHFGSDTKAARECRVSKSAMSKNLDVARCVPVIGGKITDHRGIAQRDATWLMQIVGRKPNGSDAPDGDRREKLLAAIRKLEISTARKTFATLKTAFADVEKKASKNRIALSDGDREIGFVTLKRGKPAGVSFTDIADCTPETIGDAIRHVIATHRSSQAP